MKEIKFRAVFETDHIWIEDIEWPFFVVDNTTIFDARKDKYKEIKVKAVLQYIGIKDKNGNEEYHKDIVEFCGFRYVIEWDDRRACFYGRQLRNKDTPYTGGIKTAQFFRQCEVIGNVYDNPELLENKNDK